MEGIAETNNQNQDEALPGPAREVVTDVPQPETQTGPADQKTCGADERTPKDMPTDTTAQLVTDQKTQAESSVVPPQTEVDEKTPQAATDEKKAQPETHSDVPQTDTQTAPADQKTFGADERTLKDMPTDATAQLVTDQKTQAESSVVAPQTVVDEKTPQAATNETKAQPESSSQAQQKKSIIMCKPCNRKFEQQNHYDNHLIHSPRHFYCKPCKRDFPSEPARKQHIAYAKVHQVCKWCKDVEIVSLALHNRWSHRECTICKKLFEDHDLYYKHCRIVHSQIYCVGCYRIFKNKNDLKMHHLSHRHQYRSFTCPARECRAMFTSESGVVAHLESGCCSSGADQAIVDKSMVIRDPKQIFVREARVCLPTKHEVPSGKRINPCPLCPKQFRFRAGLLQHLGSSKHTNNGRNPYKCPASTCDNATFPSLSSLLFHKERGDCGLDKDTVKIALLDRYLYDLFDRIRNM
ncbi:hypothetical protein PSTG_16142 [Puccinia striiformis f. sp. tritici PST-78]|uniref:C2H2-type domain-containing protein n=1 Tax=Puccinia striiformis f. sp. tritici PST-78 TaxID=1165861 RepID=A0A0L0UTX9_9BASI|nr:hypothetical protein PSTG_16142 [Puccinia striiformis f. sp. tritici PST-78]